MSIGGAECGHFSTNVVQTGTSHIKHTIFTVVTHFVHGYSQKLYYAGANTVVPPAILYGTHSNLAKQTLPRDQYLENMVKMRILYGRPHATRNTFMTIVNLRVKLDQ